LLILTEADVHAALRMDECISAIEAAMRGLANGEYFQPLRMKAIPPEAKNRMVFMPARRSSVPPLWGVKTIVVTPENSTRGLDSHQGAVLLHDGDTGELRAIVHAGAVTAIRTAAASAVATLALARKDARRAAVLGVGVQGRAHLQAMRAILPNAEFAVWSRDIRKSQAAAAEFDVSACETVEEACAHSDVLCTVTAARDPIVSRAMIPVGCHINAVGSSVATAREISSDLFAAAALFVDRRESTLNESGDYLFAVQELGLGPEHIRAELGDVLAGKAQGRRTEDEITLYKSLGIGLQDVAAAELACSRAEEMGLGTSVVF
jgi:ornithine cyclodeaminase/alanine dehydrogenase-like protein (mu-crystallin family)